MTQEQKMALLELVGMLLRLIIGIDVVNQRKWQNDWNGHAEKLDGLVPKYPVKRLVR